MSDNSDAAIEIPQSTDVAIPDQLCLLSSHQFVLYPFMIAPLLVQDPKLIRMIDEVMSGDNRILGVFTVRKPREPEEEDSGVTPGDGSQQKDDAGEQPSDPSGAEDSFFDHVHQVGTAAMVLKMLKIPDGSMRLLVHGLKRVHLKESLAEDPYPRARVEMLEDERHPEGDNELKALQKNAREMLQKMVEQSNLPEDLVVAANNMEDPGRLADLIASNLPIHTEEQQEILEQLDIKKRLHRIQEILNRELEIAQIGSRIQSEVKSKLEQSQREYIMREQIKALRRELGEEKEPGAELDEIEERIAKAELPEEVDKTVRKELSRLRAMSPASAEYTVSRTYIDWLVDLPWNQSTEDNLVLEAAQKILDQDHYDLEEIKDRILEFLAVIKLRQTMRGPILCFIGPPGTGKTSLGRSIARSLGRKFIRMSLGGMHDEAEIRGHRRTYIGAMPGRMIKSLRDAGSNNPVFMLDEIDKIGMDYRGDPASALLEVLDPEQNFSFTDHYLDLPFDLSNVMFITTGNSLDTVPPALRDRMEVLHLSGYTMFEKMKIARQYLLPRAIENTGLASKHVQFLNAGLETIIEFYTRESGVRNLEREITSVCRKVARRVATGEGRKVKIGAQQVHEFLGPPKHDRDELEGRTRFPGVAVALAWTPVGGEVLFIEVNAAPGDGKLALTGQLGDVMKESAHAARSWLHAHASELDIEEDMFKQTDLHLHVPAGAIPKDGPSAGLAMLTAMASLMRGERVRGGLAMTGEITIKGAVLPVGGIKEKVLAAHRSGVKEVVLPKRNEKNLVDVPEEIRKKIDFRFVDAAGEMLEVAFEKSGRRRGAASKSPSARSKKSGRSRSRGRKKGAAKNRSTRPAGSSRGKTR